MKNLLDKIFGGDKVEVETITDEERVQLSDDIKSFLRGNVWSKVIKPFTEDRTRTELINFINDGVKYSKEEVNVVIALTRFSLSLKQELKLKEIEGDSARKRLLKRVTRK